MKSKGFSLVNLVVGIAVAGGLTVVAMPIYHTYIAKSQAAEADRLINTERIHVFSNMQGGSCLSGNTPSPQEGRYGTLALSGNFEAKSGKSCPSGCEITYTFGANTNKLIAGKKVVVNVLMDGGVTKNNKTTLQDKFWASDITRADAVVVGDNCTALAVETPTFTAGAAPAGNEIGATAPESGVVIPPVTPPPVTPPTPPSGGADSGGGAGSGGATVVPAKITSLIIDSSYLGTSDLITGYYAKPAVNLYDFFVARMGRVPEPNEDVRFTIDTNVAVIGKINVKASGNYKYKVSLRTSGGVIIDPRWTSTNTVRILNKGVISGYNGVQRKADEKSFKNIYMNGGDAISNTSTAKVEITNNGVIGGGGGAATNNPGARVVYYGPDGAPTHGSLFLGTLGSGYFHRSGGMGEHGEKHGKLPGGVPGYIVSGNPVIWIERGDLRGR